MNLRKEVQGDWIKLCNEELYDFITRKYSIYCVIRSDQIRSGRMRWSEHMSYVAKRINVYVILMREVKARDPLEETGVDKRTILKCTSEK